MKAHALLVALVTTAVSSNALAVPVSGGGVFDFYSPIGMDLNAPLLDGSQSLANVDNTIATFVDAQAGTWGVASTQLFFGSNWTASNGHLITTPGIYSLDTATGTVGPGNGVNDVLGCGTSGYPLCDGYINFNVGAGQVAGTIDFAWGSAPEASIVNVWNIGPSGNLVAAYAPGMENGVFPGFSAAFNLDSSYLCTPEGCTPPPPFPEPRLYALMIVGLGMVGLLARTRRKVV